MKPLKIALLLNLLFPVPSAFTQPNWSKPGIVLLELYVNGQRINMRGNEFFSVYAYDSLRAEEYNIGHPSAYLCPFCFDPQMFRVIDTLWLNIQMRYRRHVFTFPYFFVEETKDDMCDSFIMRFGYDFRPFRDEFILSKIEQIPDNVNTVRYIYFETMDGLFRYRWQFE